MLSQMDIERRWTCLGASDIARIVTGEFGGAGEVVAEKLYRTSKETTDAMELGNLAEPATLDWFSRAHPEILTERQYVATHESGLIQATCDAITTIPEPVEAKLVFPWNRHRWTDDRGDDRVSDYAFTQVQTQMLCLSADRGFVVVWFVSEGRKWFEVPADPEFQQAVLECARRTWVCVEQKCLPEPSGPLESMEAWSPRIRKALARVEVREGEIQLATPRETEFVQAWEQVKAIGTKFSAAADAARDWLLARMGTAEILVLDDGRRYRRSVVERAGYTVEESRHVELREVKSRKAK